MGKKKIIKKYELLGPELLELVKKAYPDGFEDQLITFQSPSGELELAIPLETDEAYYMIKIPKDNLPEDEDDDGSSDNSDNLGNFENLEVAEDFADEDNEDD